MTTPIILFSDYQKNINTGTAQAVGADFKARVRELIESVSDLIEKQCNRRFDRYYLTRFYSSVRQDLGGHITDDGALLLDADLIEVESLINNHTIAVDPADYILFPLDSGAPAKDMIRLQNGLYWTGVGGLGLYNAISVTGFWGWGGAYKQRATLTADLSDSASIIPVSDSSAFEMGQMLNINGELMLIDQEVSGLNLHVERAYNGSPALVHDNGDSVYVFRADPTVRRLALRLVKWQSSLDDNPLLASLTINDTQEPLDLGAMPTDAKKMIEVLTRPESIGGV